MSRLLKVISATSTRAGPDDPCWYAIRNGARTHWQRSAIRRPCGRPRQRRERGGAAWRWAARGDASVHRQERERRALGEQYESFQRGEYDSLLATWRHGGMINWRWTRRRQQTHSHLRRPWLSRQRCENSDVPIPSDRIRRRTHPMLSPSWVCRAAPVPFIRSAANVQRL